MLLEGRIGLITGAGQGNGAAIASGLAREGAVVVVTDVDGGSAHATASKIRDCGGRASSYRLDVSEPEECIRIASQVGAEVGAISILVNNAGICPRNTIDDANARSVWNQAINVNLNGTLNVTMAFLDALRRTRGTIINMASISAFVSTATSMSYSTSKAAIKMLTQNLAQELAPNGVRVNALAPGPLITAMTEATRNDPVRRDRFLSRIPMGRFGEPEELVGPVVFLASTMASYITGTTLVVDGGYLAV